MLSFQSDCGVPMKNLLKDVLRSFGYELKSLSCPKRCWEQDMEFMSLYHAVRGKTLLDIVSCHVLYQLARNARILAGDVAEVGVYWGGSAKLLAKAMMPYEKTIHLFDTFRGLPEPHEQYDRYRRGAFSDTSLEGVEHFLKDCPHTRIYPGVFPQTASPLKDTRFCLVHVDIDIYPSALDCCRFFYPRLTEKGVMIFDDYGYPSCPGVEKAVNDFFEEKIETPIYLPTGQCVVIKV